MNSYLATTLTLLLTLELGSCGHYYYKRPTKSVFAPTNEAFAKIPSDALAGLLEDVPALTEVLLRHVVPGKTVKLYKSAQSVDNAGGSKVTVNGYTVTTSAASPMVIGKVS